MKLQRLFRVRFQLPQNGFSYPKRKFYPPVNKRKKKLNVVIFLLFNYVIFSLNEPFQIILKTFIGLENCAVNVWVWLMPHQVLYWVPHLGSSVTLSKKRLVLSLHLLLLNPAFCSLEFRVIVLELLERIF